MPAKNLFDESHLRAALNTLDSSRWQYFKARLFGRRVITEDRGHRVVMREYGGKFYMTDYRRPEHEQ